MKPMTLPLALVAALVLSAPAAYAVPITFTAVLSGPNEAPPNASPGTGFATVIFDVVAHTMEVHVTFAGLVAGNTASHIHCCTTVADAGTAGVATTTPTFTGFPTGTTFGTYDHTFDITLASSYNPAFVAARTPATIAQAEIDLLNGMLAEKTYLNIHSSTFPGGDIRGFLKEVPEPTTLLLLGSGLAAAGLRSRRRRT